MTVGPHRTQTGLNTGVPPEEIFRKQEEPRRRQPARLQTENTPLQEGKPDHG